MRVGRDASVSPPRFCGFTNPSFRFVREGSAAFRDGAHLGNSSGTALAARGGGVDARIHRDGGNGWRHLKCIACGGGPKMTAQKPETTNLFLTLTSLIHDFCGDFTAMDFKRLTIDNEDSDHKSKRAAADDSRLVLEKYPNFAISVVCARALPLTDCTYGGVNSTDDSGTSRHFNHEPPVKILPGASGAANPIHLD